MPAMSGAALYAYLLRRLGDDGNNVETAREATLYDYLTEARDEVRKRLALVRPDLFCTPVTLEQDGSDSTRWAFPAATADPERVVAVRDPVTLEVLRPAATLEHDDGWYAWRDPRALQLASWVTADNGLEALAVLDGAAITADTTDAQVGLPSPCHRAVGKVAAVLALTEDEASDAANARADAERELDRLESLYGSYDVQGGAALGEALRQHLY